jgi:hypothetical protein
MLKERPAMKYQVTEVSLRNAIRLAFSIIVLVVVPTGGAALAQNGGLYVYPAKGQSQEQQQKDRYQCNSWAVQQTGVDPTRAETIAAPPTNSQQYQPSKPHVLQGAGRGAALGAVGGAIAGDAGKGAAAGAAMGGVGGAFRRRDEKKQQAAQQQANAQAAQQSRLTSYNRAMAACLQGRGYTVN